MTSDLVKKFEEQSDVIIARVIATKPNTDNTVIGALDHYEWYLEAQKNLNEDLKKQIGDLTSDSELIEQMRLIAINKVNIFMKDHK